VWLYVIDKVRYPGIYGP